MRSAIGLLRCALLTFPHMAFSTLAIALAVPAVVGVLPAIDAALWLIGYCERIEERQRVALDDVTFAGAMLVIGVPGFLCVIGAQMWGAT